MKKLTRVCLYSTPRDRHDECSGSAEIRRQTGAWQLVASHRMALPQTIFPRHPTAQRQYPQHLGRGGLHWRQSHSTVPWTHIRCSGPHPPCCAPQSQPAAVVVPLRNWQCHALEGCAWHAHRPSAVSGMVQKFEKKN